MLPLIAVASLIFAILPYVILNRFFGRRLPKRQRTELGVASLCAMAATVYGARFALLLSFSSLGSNMRGQMILYSILDRGFIEFFVEMPFIAGGIVFGGVFFALKLYAKLRKVKRTNESADFVLVGAVLLIFLPAMGWQLYRTFGFTPEQMLELARDRSSSPEVLERIFSSLGADGEVDRVSSEVLSELVCHPNTPLQVRIDMWYLGVGGICSAYQAQISAGTPSASVVEILRRRYHEFDGRDIPALPKEQVTQFYTLVGNRGLPIELIEDAFRRSWWSAAGKCSRGMDDSLQQFVFNANTPAHIREAIYELLKPMGSNICRGAIRALASSKETPVSVMIAMIDHTSDLHNFFMKNPSFERDELTLYRNTVITDLEHNTAVPDDVMIRLREVKGLNGDYPKPPLSDEESRNCDDMYRRFLDPSSEASGMKVFLGNQIGQCSFRGWKVP